MMVFGATISTHGRLGAITAHTRKLLLQLSTRNAAVFLYIDLISTSFAPPPPMYPHLVSKTANSLRLRCLASVSLSSTFCNLSQVRRTITGIPRTEISQKTLVCTGKHDQNSSLDIPERFQIVTIPSQSSDIASLPRARQHKQILGILYCERFLLLRLYKSLQRLEPKLFLLQLLLEPSNAHRPRTIRTAEYSESSDQIDIIGTINAIRIVDTAD